VCFKTPCIDINMCLENKKKNVLHRQKTKPYAFSIRILITEFKTAKFHCHLLLPEKKLIHICLQNCLGISIVISQCDHIFLRKVEFRSQRVDGFAYPIAISTLFSFIQDTFSNSTKSKLE
jgi:hypothetical protein